METGFHQWRLTFVMLQTCKETTDIGALQKATDFVRAFTLGFEVDVSRVCDMQYVADYLSLCY